MHEETKLIVDAISSLKHDANYFDDYMFPIVSAFFSSMLGAAIAYVTLNWQERTKIEKEKLDTANKWILIAEEARSNLLAIKGNYHGQLDDNPFMRAGLIPTILIYDNPIVVESHELSFVIPTEKSGDGTYPKWGQVPIIRAMLGNYNQAVSMWKERNILNEEFKEKLQATHGDTVVDGFSLKHAVDAVGKPFLIKFIDLTERLVRLTDDLIVELDDFLEHFPKHAKTKIQCKKIKKYGSVLTYSNNENQALIKMLEKSPISDFTPFESLFGEKNEVIKSRQRTGYE